MPIETNAAPFDLAGRSERLAAVLLDALLSLPVALAALVFSGGFEALLGHQTLQPKQVLVLALWGWVGFLGINSYTLLKNGQTIGKYFMRVRIANLNGGVPPFWKIVLLRYLPLQVVTLFGFLGSLITTVDSLLIFRSSRRCMHDVIAGTRVLKA